MEKIEICGESRQIKELVSIADRIARTDATVLITGASGTGKDLFANYIQAESLRAEKKFVTVNCAAIPGNLMESEFFGHKKGAFTDAVSDYAGKIKAADGGTLFLDEIGELNLSLQSKLLRFLQYRVYYPVGSNEELQADVRLIAATNKDLLNLVYEKKFREDLYYRLNVIPLKIQPLKERRQDILILADHFLKKYNQKNNKNIIGFDVTVRSKLKNHCWKGNVRELENVTERAVVLCEDKKIREKDVWFLNEEQANLHKSEEIKGLKEALEEFKKEYIIACLDRLGWNQTRAAEQLKIQRTYLARLIKDLNINKI